MSYRPWGHKESDTTEQLNNSNNKGICHLPLQTEPYVATAVDLQHPLREFRVE